jgi:hypothetical protein
LTIIVWILSICIGIFILLLLTAEGVYYANMCCSFHDIIPATYRPVLVIKPVIVDRQQTGLSNTTPNYVTAFAHSRVGGEKMKFAAQTRRLEA